MAVNCCVPLGATEALAGVTVIDTRGLVMVRTAEFETMLPCVAVMVLVPAVTPVARPPAVIVAPVVALHVTVEVMFFVEVSL